MNEIVGNSRILGKSKLLDQKFEAWWRFLNGWGMFSFLIAIGIHGSDYQYLKAIIALPVLTWIYLVGRRHCWPHELTKIRKNNKEVAKEIEADYLSVKILVTKYFPFAVGFAYICLIAGYPLFICQSFSMYLDK